MTRKRTRIAGTLITATLLTAVAACGGGSSSGGGGSNASSADTSAFNNKIDKLVAEGSAPQSNRPPSNGPVAQKNKKIFIIPCAMVASGCATSALAGQKAAKAIGWDVTFIDPAGDPIKQNNAIETAVAQKADGILLTAIDASTVSKSLKRAQDAGIKVVCFACDDPDGKFDALVPASPKDAYDSGYLAMAALYSQTNRDLKVLMVQGPEYGIATGKFGRQSGAKAFVDECKKAGGKCEIVAKADVLTANLTTTVPGQVVSVARQHPEANAMWGFADPILAFIIPAMQKANIKLKAAGIDPTSYNYDLIRKGEWEQASISPAMDWVGYGSVDNLNRMFAGEKPVDQGVKGKLIMTKNIPHKGDFQGDFDVIPVYEKLWKING